MRAFLVSLQISCMYRYITEPGEWCTQRPFWVMVSSLCHGRCLAAPQKAKADLLLIFVVFVRGHPNDPDGNPAEERVAPRENGLKPAFGYERATDEANNH